MYFVKLLFNSDSTEESPTANMSPKNISLHGKSSQPSEITNSFQRPKIEG